MDAPAESTSSYVMASQKKTRSAHCTTLVTQLEASMPSSTVHSSVRRNDSSVLRSSHGFVRTWTRKPTRQKTRSTTWQPDVLTHVLLPLRRSMDLRQRSKVRSSIRRSGSAEWRSSRQVCTMAFRGPSQSWFHLATLARGIAKGGGRSGYCACSARKRPSASSSLHAVSASASPLGSSSPKAGKCPSVSSAVNIAPPPGRRA
mmetsp:Transcript_1536/g.4643  ORF Transcript_1536/g.4643 Transcript_1536/m.4643 type:complete len:202 (+) Transcript_1536:860-1465(+)